MTLAPSRESEVFMLRAHRSLAALLAILGMIVMVGLADAQGKGKGKEKEKGKGKHHHLSGQQLLGDKIKTNGNHPIHKNGKHTVTASVRDGKITGVSVKHSEKGDVPVTKYKTKKKMAARTGEPDGISLVSYHGVLAQVQDLGMTYIGYAYTDDYGEEYIYWFPVEMIYDGDTGAIEYVALD